MPSGGGVCCGLWPCPRPRTARTTAPSPARITARITARTTAPCSAAWWSTPADPARPGGWPVAGRPDAAARSPCSRWPRPRAETPEGHMSRGEAREAVEASFRAAWPLLVATAMRILGDLQEAEDVAQEVLVTALDRWPLTGVPDNPAAWLTTASRNRALNRLRDAGRARGRALALVPLLPADAALENGKPAIADDRLRLV